MATPQTSRSSSQGGFPAEAFDQLAALENGNYWFESRNRLIVWAVGRYFPEARTLLEVGCGTGFVLSAVHEAFPRLQLTASDALEEGLAVARSRVPSASFVRVDARDIDYHAEFDLACAFDVFEHIQEDALAIERLYAAARPGGGAIVTVPQHPELWSHADDYGHHVRRYRRRELIERMEHAGFAIIRATSFVSMLLPLMALSRRLDAARADEFDPFREFHLPQAVNVALGSVLALERLSIRMGVSWPAGGSLLIVARKPPRSCYSRTPPVCTPSPSG